MPVVFGAALFIIAPIVGWLTAMNAGGDLGRWAAMATMWLLLPIMLAGVILLIALVTFIFIGAKITSWLPKQTYQLQRISARAESGTRRAAEFVRKPVLAFKEAGSMAARSLKRLRERV